MKNDLKERYIYAVVRHLPKNKQEEVSKELDGMISEMMEAEVRDSRENAPFERGPEDVKDILNRLGPPEEMALSYCSDTDKALISGTNYLSYKRTLKIVLPIVLLAVTAINIFGLIVEETNFILQFGFMNIHGAGGFAQLTNGVVGAILQTAFIITAIYAIIERTSGAKDKADFIKDLPEATPKGEAISRGEAIFGIVASVFVAVILLGYPELFAATSSQYGRIAVFNVNVLRSLWPPIILWAAVGIAAEVAALAIGRYNTRLALVTTVANGIIVACAAAIFLNINYDVINASFVAFLENNFDVNSLWLTDTLSRSNVVVFAVVVVGAAIETTVMWFKALRAKAAVV